MSQTKTIGPLFKTHTLFPILVVMLKFVNRSTFDLDHRLLKKALHIKVLKYVEGVLDLARNQILGIEGNTGTDGFRGICTFPCMLPNS